MELNVRVVVAGRRSAAREREGRGGGGIGAIATPCVWVCARFLKTWARAVPCGHGDA